MTRRSKAPASRWMYDAVLNIFASMVNLFFREIQVRGAWRVPTSGPIILVAGPHANQVCKHLPVKLVVVADYHILLVC